MIGEALRLIRVFHDMKSSELAKELGISSSYLSEIESGKKQPSLELINKYAEIFNTSSHAILFFSEDLDKNKGPFKVSMRNKILKFLNAVEKITIDKKDDE
jgi:transcriptional regulator with XRE-family HTH domain